MADDSTLIGADQLIRVLARGGPAAAHHVEVALFEEANEAFAASQREVPVETGALRASGHVRPPRSTPTGVVVVLAYGGVAAPYAAAVHEVMDAKHDDPTKAKYLEGPVNRSIRGMERRMAEAVERALAEEP